MQEGLLALAVGTGMQVMTVLREADVSALAGQEEYGQQGEEYPAEDGHRAR